MENSPCLKFKVNTYTCIDFYVKTKPFVQWYIVNTFKTDKYELIRCCFLRVRKELTLQR